MTLCVPHVDDREALALAASRRPVFAKMAENSRRNCSTFPACRSGL